MKLKVLLCVFGLRECGYQAWRSGLRPLADMGNACLGSGKNANEFREKAKVNFVKARQSDRFRLDTKEKEEEFEEETKAGRHKEDLVDWEKEKRNI